MKDRPDAGDDCVWYPLKASRIVVASAFSHIHRRLILGKPLDLVRVKETGAYPLDGHAAPRSRFFGFYRIWAGSGAHGIVDGWRRGLRYFPLSNYSWDGLLGVALNLRGAA